MLAGSENIRGMAARHSAQQVLFELQVEQHKHDETYHREIARLSLHQRLNHMALHFAKYTGKIGAAERIADTVPVYVDILIIAISTANILNIELWELVEAHESDYSTLQTFARKLASEIPTAIDDHIDLFRETAIASGRMAAACEKIDHLEEINFRAEIRYSLVPLVCLSLAVMADQGVDPAEAVHTRLEKVKQRLRLHNWI
jgi:hypothetical protein